MNLKGMELAGKLKKPAKRKTSLATFSALQDAVGKFLQMRFAFTSFKRKPIALFDFRLAYLIGEHLIFLPNLFHLRRAKLSA